MKKKMCSLPDNTSGDEEGVGLWDCVSFLTTYSREKLSAHAQESSRPRKKEKKGKKEQSLI